MEPALTVEEWAAWRIEPLSLKGQLVVHDDADGLEIVTYENPGDVAGMAKFKIDTWDRGGIAGVMALANHALPDDDPRKITRADVENLRDEARAQREQYSDEHMGLWLDGLADKLAALLPQEGSTGN